MEREEITMETLRRFCDTNADGNGLSRPWMAMPFSIGGFSYATDSVICVRVPRLCGPRELSEYPNFVSSVEYMFAQSPKGIWGVPPSVPQFAEYKTCEECDGLGSKKRCPECCGSGELEFSSTNSRYVCECKTCEGEGTVPSAEGSPCAECGGSGKIKVPSLIQFGDPAVGPVDGGKTYGIRSDVLEKITTLPGLEINTSPVSCGVFHFRFRGGDGVLMGIRSR